MGLILGTSTPASTSSSTLLTLSSPDLSYTVILLMILSALLFIDLVRRLFTRR